MNGVHNHSGAMHDLYQMWMEILVLTYQILHKIKSTNPESSIVFTKHDLKIYTSSNYSTVFNVEFVVTRATNIKKNNI